jgi:hypothetical protein
MTTQGIPWWKKATADDASDARRVIHQFLDAPNPDDADKFSRALALFILLGGSDSSIPGKLDKIDGYPKATIGRNALSVCQTMLEQFPDAIPDWFEKSAKEISRRAAKAFDDNIEYIKRTAPPPITFKN